MVIKLNTIENAKAFCKVCGSNDYRDTDIDITCGRYVIDAKSILGILSMDLTKCMTVVFHGSNQKQKDTFFERIGEWEYNE